MQEPALDWRAVNPTPQGEIVRLFCKELWGRADERRIGQVVHTDFTCRGSPGPALVGHKQVAGCVDVVTGTFRHCTTDILSMTEEGNRVAGQMRFHGNRQEELFGASPSGRHLWWAGMPIFAFEGGEGARLVRSGRYPWADRSPQGKHRLAG